MRILITNDDGIHAPGFRALVETLRAEGDCVPVAPHKQCSATGHSISLYQHISVETVDLGNGLQGHAIEGTPADCVKFAVAELSKDRPFDLIVSGINLGLNTGISVYYSGTVSAAREGLINGIPAVALSQAKERVEDFSYAANLAKKLTHDYRAGLLPKDIFLNINIPASDIKGIRVTKQAHSRFVEWFEPHAQEAPNDKKSYNIYGDLEMIAPDGTSDEEALREGYVSFTPLQLDLTHYGRISYLQSWVTKFLQKIKP